MVFRGLAVPGVEGNVADDLVTIWRSKGGERFQNYRALFTILNAGAISREWIDAVNRAGNQYAEVYAQLRT